MNSALSGHVQQTYRYTALGKGSLSMRLLSLQYDKFAYIRCTLHTYKLSRCQPYITLSYTWGPPIPAKEIILDGQPFAIRENFRAFLNALKIQGTAEQMDDPPPFWADAICIDQQNLDERGRQVSMMRDIFATAELTIAWLEEGDGVSAAILEYATAESEDTLVVHPGARLLDMARSLIDRDYWKRLRIVQEFLAAQEVLIMCGARVCTPLELHVYH